MEEELEELFDGETEPPAPERVETVRQLLLDASVEVVADQTELVEVQDDLRLDAELDQAEAEADPVGQYLQDIRDIPLLTAAQEVELAQRIEAGDDEALRRFTLANLVADQDALGPGEAAQERLLKEEAARTLERTLTERERLVLQLRFGLGDGHVYPLEKIGQHLGLTRERVRQIEREALRKLRAPEAGGRLRSYLPE